MHPGAPRPHQRSSIGKMSLRDAFGGLPLKKTKTWEEKEEQFSVEFRAAGGFIYDVSTTWPSFDSVADRGRLLARMGAALGTAVRLRRGAVGQLSLRPRSRRALLHILIYSVTKLRYERLGS